jgi:hypothetical protein
VKLSPGSKWFIIASLLLTIAWKLVIKPENPADVVDAITEFVANHQFEASVTDKTMEYMPIIEATSDSCHLWVARISPLGLGTDLVRHIGAAPDRVFYVFRGMVYSEQPVGLTVVSYLWCRFLRELGLVSRIPPVFAVVSSCNAEQLPWSKLRSQGPD